MILNQASVSIRQLDDGRFDVDVIQSKEGGKTVKSGYASIHETHEAAVRHALVYLQRTLVRIKIAEDELDWEDDE